MSKYSDDSRDARTRSTKYQYGGDIETDAQKEAQMLSERETSTDQKLGEQVVLELLVELLD